MLSRTAMCTAASTRCSTTSSAARPEQLALSVPGTYGSIGETLDHFVSSDRSYLAGVTVNGRMPPEIDVWGYGMAEGKLVFPDAPPPPAPWKSA